MKVGQQVIVSPSSGDSFEAVIHKLWQAEDGTEHMMLGDRHGGLRPHIFHKKGEMDWGGDINCKISQILQPSLL